MIKNKSKGIVLTKRDYQLFRFLFRGKVSTLVQINRHIFSSIGEKTVHRRLNKLAKANFLAKDVFLYNDKPKITYGLGELGLDKIREQLPYRAPKKPQKSDSPEHDITLNEIRFALIKSRRIVSCLSESELQSSPDFRNDHRLKPYIELNSDGVLFLSKGNETVLVALEYDANKKTTTRYKEKLMDYYKHSSIAAVFYIGRDKGILSMVQNAERMVAKDVDRKFKLYYSNLENVLGDIEQVVFENLSGRIFKF